MYSPGPERDEETKVREEEDSSILVDRIEDRNRFRLLIDRIDLWRTPELSQFEPHTSNPGNSNNFAERFGGETGVAAQG